MAPAAKRARQAAFGMVFQTDALFDSLTVRRNVLLPLERRRVPREEAEARADEVLRAVGLAEAANTLPERLSGGMRKRAGIARALAARPSVLLADEPFSGLDPGTARQVARVLLEVAGSGSLIVIGGAVAAIKLFPKETASAAPVQVEIPALAPEERARLEQWWELQPKVEMPIAPSSGVKVHIVKFSDYQCPGCRAAHDVFRMVLPRYDKSAVEFVMKHYPLEPECNPNVPGGDHRASCEAAAAYVMARGTGFQQQIDDWLFANQQTLTRDSIKEALRSQAGIQDFDARYDAALQEVRTDASTGALLKVGSTPTVYVNGRMISGRLPNGQSMGMPQAKYLNALIDIELKRAK